jgi:hypothetical protein
MQRHHLTDGPLTDAQLAAHAPAVFAADAHQITSTRYQFISTAQIVTALRSEGFVPVRAQQTRARALDRRGHARHLVVFRAPDSAPRLVGDVTPEIVLLNAHDGTGAYQLHAGLFRLVCANGLIVSDATLAAIKVPHFGQRVVADVLDGMQVLLHALPDVLAQIDAWRATTLSPEFRLAYARAALALRYADGTAPIAPAQLLAARRLEDRLPDLFTTFNMVQEHLLRGRLPGQRADGRAVRTRRISAVTETMRLNKALWTLTENYADRRN